MPSIFERTMHDLHLDHDQETSVTAPQTQIAAQPQRNVMADLSAVLAELSANGLISRLFARRLGSRLSAEQIDHVTAIIEAIETAGTGGVTPAWLPAPLAADAQQAAAGQQAS